MPVDPYYEIDLNPRRPYHRINRVDAGNCLASINFTIPLLAEEECPSYEGSGVITIAGGGYLRWAYATIKELRKRDRDVPVEIWHLPGEDIGNRDLFDEFNVSWHDVGPAFDHESTYLRTGWAAKAHAIKHSKLRNVMFLDADSVPRKRCTKLLESKEFQEYPILLWRDVAEYNSGMIWPALGLHFKSVNEHEAGQFLIDKVLAWKALQLYCWMSGHRYFHDACFGDKSLLGLSAAKLNVPYLEAPLPENLPWGIRHFWFDGKVFTDHSSHAKRGPVPTPADIQRMWEEYDQRVSDKQLTAV